MRWYLISCVILVLALSAIGESHHHHGESIFRKFGDDIKGVADKFAHDVKSGAEDVGHVAKDFGDDVAHVVKDFRTDVESAYTKAEPYLKKAFVYIDGVMKTLEQIEDANDLIEILAEAAE